MESARFYLGDSVIWLSDDGTPEEGILKWIGKVAGHGEQCMLGIEFNNPIGNDLASFVLPNGFSAKEHYGSLLPQDAVMTMEEYETMFPDPGDLLPAEHNAASSRKVCQSKEKTCIITVGSSETGKSSTVQLYTLQNCMAYNADKLESVKYALFSNKRNPELPVWLDTVGWNDSAGKDVQSLFQEFLHFITLTNITKVHAVIWTVIPSITKDSNLQKQGEFIDRICPGKIWNNVVIVAKAGMNPDQDCQGAREVMTVKQQDASIQCVSYRYLGDPLLSEDLRNRLRYDSELRESLKVVTEDEAYLLLKERIDTITEPVEVIFQNNCMDIDAVGDERLLSKYCYMKTVMVHNGELERYHPGEREPYHPLGEDKFHPGRSETRRGFYKAWCVAQNLVRFIPQYNIILGIITEAGRQMTYPGTQYYTCCQQESSAPGCKSVWKCCKQKDTQGCKTRYNCCFNVIASRGCEKRYKCCMKDEGTIGCITECRPSQH